jgi:hypothetical protein
MALIHIAFFFANSLDLFLLYIIRIVRNSQSL